MNKNEFSTLLKANGVKKVRFARQASPDNLRREYFFKLRRTVLRDAKKLVEEELADQLRKLSSQASRIATTDSLRQDADLNSIFDNVRSKFSKTWSSKRIAEVVLPVFKNLDKFQARQLNKMLGSLVGVDVVGSEDWLKKAMDEAVRENVALIKTVPSRYFDDLERMLSKQIADGARYESLKSTLVERYEVAESNATRIARDQVGKFYADLNRVRLQDLGMDSYVWRTMRDNRVRDEHEEYEGQTYTWKTSPNGESPGEPIQCRCYAEPVLPL